MIRTSILGAALALGLAGTAGAQVFHEANAGGATQSAVGNVVGGGTARMMGGGTDTMVQRDAAGPSQAGRMARFGSAAGGGETEITYIEPVPAGALGRDAMLLGGGDNAAVVYLDTLPRRRG